jgi:hypothetical protein
MKESRKGGETRQKFIVFFPSSAFALFYSCGECLNFILISKASRYVASRRQSFHRMLLLDSVRIKRSIALRIQRMEIESKYERFATAKGQMKLTNIAI